MKTTTLTARQRRVLNWMMEEDRRSLLSYTADDGVENFTPHQSQACQTLRAKGLIQRIGNVGRNTVYRISVKGRSVLKYNQDKRATV